MIWFPFIHTGTAHSTYGDNPEALELPMSYLVHIVIIYMIIVIS